MLPNFAYAHSFSTIPLGHFKLWKLGFQHRDPSLGNLMLNPATKHGVLNDWDLGYDPHCPRSDWTHGERTGTIPFMALDLLSVHNWRGRMTRLYRHELEGFIWILVWVFIQYDGSKLKEAKLVNWSTGNYSQCRLAKRDMMDNPNQHPPMKFWKFLWPVAEDLLEWLCEEHEVRSKAFRKSRKSGYVVDGATLDVPKPYIDATANDLSSDDDQDEGLQEVVAGLHMKRSTSAQLTPDHIDNIPEVAEPTVDEVYERFCKVLYLHESLRPGLLELHMQPNHITNVASIYL